MPRKFPDLPPTALILLTFLYVNAPETTGADENRSDLAGQTYEIIRDIEDRMDLALSPYPLSAFLGVCTILNQYRVERDGVFVLPEDFRWGDLSEEEREECSKDAARILKQTYRDLAVIDRNHYASIASRTLENSIGQLNRMASVAQLIDDFNNTQGFMPADDFRRYEAAILSNAFREGFSSDLYASLEPVVDRILGAEERLLNSSRTLQASEEEVRSALREMGVIASWSNGTQVAMIKSIVDGAALRIELLVEGVPNINYVEFQNEVSEDAIGYRSFREVNWVIPTVFRPSVDPDALARARRITAFRSCNRAGGAGACCGHIFTEEICFLRVCGTEYNKPKIYAQVCEGVAIDRPHPLEGCTMFPSDDDWRPACE